MAQRIVGIKYVKKLATVPVVENVTGCEEASTLGCEGSGSGNCGDCNAPECVSTCGQCESISGLWTFSYNGATVQLCYLADPVDGNACTWISTDLEWKLYHSAEDAIWLLVNFETEQVFFLVEELWDCVGVNTLDEVEGEASVEITPVGECGSTPWACIEGECVEFANGPFADEAACLADECGPPSECYPGLDFTQGGSLTFDPPDLPLLACPGIVGLVIPMGYAGTVDASTFGLMGFTDRTYYMKGT